MIVNTERLLSIIGDFGGHKKGFRRLRRGCGLRDGSQFRDNRRGGLRRGNLLFGQRCPFSLVLIRAAVRRFRYPACQLPDSHLGVKHGVGFLPTFSGNQEISEAIKKALISNDRAAESDLPSPNMKFLKPIKKGFLQSFSEKRRRRDSRKPEADAPGLFSLLLTAFPRLLVSFTRRR